MQKRKSLFSIVLVVLVLVLAVAMLVACNNQKAKYTITFNDGSDPAKTVTLEEGKALTDDQIPEAKSIEGKVFDGWYIGETKVEAGYTPTENVTADAKYSTAKVTVSFVNGDVKIDVTVDYNAAIAADKLPANAQPADSRIFVFDGWFDGETKFASDMTFTANRTFIAKFNRTGYLVTFSNPTAQAQSIVQAVAINDEGVASLPNGLIPADRDVPSVAGKVFIGFYNGANKAVVNMPITDDVNFVACYVGEEDYIGLWADDENKLVVLIDSENDFVSLGTDTEYYRYFSFNTDNGKFEYTSGSTSWSLLIEGDGLKVTKMSEASFPVTYVMTKVTKEVDFAGEYIRKGYSDTLSILNGGYVLIGDYSYRGADYQYAKLSENNGVYTLTVVDEDGNVKTASAVVSNSILTVGGDVDVAGIWIKDATYKFRIYAKSNYDSIIKYEVDGEYIYVYLDENNVYSLITADKEIVQEGDELPELDRIVTLTFPDNSKRFIKMGYYDYLFAGNEAGTYTYSDGVESQTIVLDGFGNARISGMSGAFSYTVLSENLIFIKAFGQRVQLNGNTFSVIESDSYAGEYYQLNNDSYNNSKLEFDGFGVVTLYTGDYGYDEVVGSYEVDEQNGTIRIVGVVYEEVEYDGVYTVLFDGETLCCNGTYFGKEADSKINLLTGTWIDSNAENTVEIEYNSSLTVTFNDNAATDIIPLKYDKSVLQFKIDSNVYVLALENGVVTVTADGHTVATLLKDVTIDAKFIGTWAAKDESKTFDLIVEEKKITLNGENAINIESGYSLRFTVNGVDYVLYILSAGPELDFGDEEIEMVDANSSGGTVGDKITNVYFHGTWELSLVDEGMPSASIVINETSVTIGGVEVTNLKFNDAGGYNGEISFTYDGKNYTISKESMFGATLLKLVGTDKTARMDKIEE